MRARRQLHSEEITVDRSAVRVNHKITPELDPKLSRCSQGRNAAGEEKSHAQHIAWSRLRCAGNEIWIRWTRLNILHRYHSAPHGTATQKTGLLGGDIFDQHLKNVDSIDGIGHGRSSRREHDRPELNRSGKSDHDPVYRSSAGGGGKADERASFWIVVYPTQSGNPRKPLLQSLTRIALRPQVAFRSGITFSARIALRACITLRSGIAFLPRIAFCARISLGSGIPFRSRVTFWSGITLRPWIAFGPRQSWITLRPLCSAAFSAEALDNFRQRGGAGQQAASRAIINARDVICGIGGRIRRRICLIFEGVTHNKILDSGQHNAICDFAARASIQRFPYLAAAR